jgi:hypothetical protein
MIEYIIRNNKKLILNKPRKLTQDMAPEDLAPEYPEKIYKKINLKGWPKYKK